MAGIGQKIKGMAETAWGNATNDPEAKMHGQMDQAAGDARHDTGLGERADPGAGLNAAKDNAVGAGQHARDAAVDAGQQTRDAGGNLLDRARDAGGHIAQQAQNTAGGIQDAVGGAAQRTRDAGGHAAETTSSVVGGAGQQAKGLFEKGLGQATGDPAKQMQGEADNRQGEATRQRQL